MTAARAALEMAERELPDLATVHAEHVEYVWRCLQRFGVRDADLEDALQEVFVVVHRRLDSWDGSAALRTWLFGIALRVAAAFRRKAHRRHERIVEDPLAGRAAPEEESPERLAADGEARARLIEILDAMDLEKRAVLVMFEVEGLSCPEIARTIGIPVGTVYSRLDAARREFRERAERAIRRQRGVRT